MGATGTLTARQWAQLMGLALLVAVAIVALVAVVLPAAALALAVAMLVTAVAAAAQRASAVARAARGAAARAYGAGEAPQPTLRLELADGHVVAARPVPMAGESEHALLLTRDGYVVVSAEGRVLHRL